MSAAPRTVAGKLAEAALIAALGLVVAVVGDPPLSLFVAGGATVTAAYAAIVAIRGGTP